MRSDKQLITYIDLAKAAIFHSKYMSWFNKIMNTRNSDVPSLKSEDFKKIVGQHNN